MATQRPSPSPVLKNFHRHDRFRIRGPHFLLLFNLLLVTVSSARAQTAPQQYVYGGSLGGAPLSTVSGFSKNGQTGALIPLASSPFNERLEGGPLAIGGKGKFLFVLNQTSNDISMFQIDQTSGALTEVPASPFKVPKSNPNFAQPPGNPTAIAASDALVFVGYGTSDVQPIFSAVVSLSIDTSGARPILVTQTYADSLVSYPNQLLIDSKRLHLYVGRSNGANGQIYNGALVYDASSLALLGSAGGTNGGAGRSIAVDPQSRFFFNGRGSVGGFIDSCIISPVDGTTTSCLPPISLGAGAWPASMVVDTSGRFLYVNGGSVFSIDPSSGGLTQVLSIPNIVFSRDGTVVDPMGPYIYSYVQGNGVHVYQVNQQSGNLTEIAGSPFGNGAGSIAITGTPTQPISGPGAQIFPSSADFGSVTVGKSSSTKVFSVVNTGTAPLIITSATIAGANAASFSPSNTCATPVAPNANCSVSITFSPVSAGTLSATLKVADNAAGSPQTLALNGTGLAAVPAVTLMPGTPSFPTIAAGTTGVPQILTITNSGDAALHIASVTITGPNPSDFSLTNNCSAPVAPSASCSISLVFTPLAPGVRTAILNITDDSATSPEMVALNAIATPAATIIAPTGITTQSVAAGQPANYSLALTPGDGFSGTVSLSCTGAPLGATCSVPASVQVVSTANTLFSVAVTTSGAAHALLPYSSGPQFGPFHAWPVLYALMLVLMALLARPARAGQIRAKQLACSGAFAMMVLFAVFGVAGCGGGAASGPPPPPPVITPAGTYTLTVTPSAMSASGKPLQLMPMQLTLKVGL